MNTRISKSVLRALVSVSVMALLTVGLGASAWAAGASDADLRGYKGGLVEIELTSGVTVRAMLYSYTSEQLELEVAKGRTVKLHRTRIKTLKAAPSGAARSVLGTFPADAAMPAGAATPRAATVPPRTATPPPTSETPRATPDPIPTGTTPSGGKAGTGVRGPKRTGMVFELKLGGTMYTPYAVSGYHPSTPVSADAMIGYKIGRITIGARIDFSMAESGSGDDVSRLSMVIFAPTLQFVLMSSWPLSMYGTLSVDFGPAIASGPGSDDDVLPIVGFRAGAGMRYFLHPRFAIGAEAGFRGLWMLGDAEIGIVNIYGQASLLFIW